MSDRIVDRHASATPEVTAIPSLYGRDIGELLAPQGARRQFLPGFDDVYADIVDYIIRCTHRIWEQKDIGLIETHYSPDCRMHLMTGPIEGVSGVVANTVRTLAAFPDRTLRGEAVIWSEEGPGRYLTSHRIGSSGLNLGATEFAPATGRRATFRTIANCLCERNLIVEEWLVRDNSALLLDLRLDPRAVAKAQARQDRDAGGPAEWRQALMATIMSSPASHYVGGPLPDPMTDTRAFAHAVFSRIWDHRQFGLVRDAYDPGARCYGPGARELFGHGEITGWLAALLGCIGDARIVVDHVASVVVAEGQLDVAVRWSLAGTHDGVGMYGAPTGRPVYILGVTHWRVAAGLIVEEHIVFDEVALLRQIEGGL
ncbi:ester cyclase [Glacieibacterium sp.]|uniref:nuclear transport factor 2 family protein n=1 Tax=Glacieibacterium sp. TaxID=2860237 RepID=UPI003B0035E5